MKKNEIKYIGNYINYNDNKIMYSHKIHDSLDSVKCDLNFIISCFIQDNFGIFITDDFLFLQNPLNVNINITQSININEFSSLIFIKNGLVIDIFLNKNEKGYLFGSNNVNKHLYKFYIIKFYENQIYNEEQIPKFCDPSSLSNTYNQKSFNGKFNKNLDTLEDHEEMEYYEEYIQEKIKDPKESQRIQEIKKNLKGDLILELKNVLDLRKKFD